MAESILFSNFNLGGGVNTVVNPYLNKKEEAREALGCDFSKVGVLGRVNGYETYGNVLGNSDITGLYDFRKVNGDYKWLATNGTNLYSDESGSWTNRVNFLTAGNRVNFITHLDAVIATNGSNAVQTSDDGETWSDLGGSPPVAKYINVFNNSVYLLNIVGNETQMRWSTDGTIDQWPTDNVQDIATSFGLGDEITGSAVNNNSLIIFKNYTVWKWDLFSLKTMHTSIGCRAPRSIATIDDWTFWLSHKGVMATQGGKPFRISKQITEIINGIQDITTPVGWAEDNFYKLYVGTTNGITNCLIIYDYDNNVWSYRSLGSEVKSVAPLTDGSNSRSVYIGDDKGQVFKFDTGNSDNGRPIPFKWVSPPETSEMPHKRKRYTELYVYLDDETRPGIEVSYSVDFGEFRKLGTASNPVSELRFPPNVKGNNIRIMYQTNNTSAQQDILGHVCQGSVEPGRLQDVKK